MRKTHRSTAPALLAALALLAVLPARARAFSFTPPPPRKPPSTPALTTPIVQTIEQRIAVGGLKLRVRNLAKLPNFKGVGSKIVGMTSFEQAIYVTTSTSGAYIYRVDFPSGNVKLWFRLGEAVVEATGGKREVNCDNTAHGGLRGVAFPPDFRKTGLFYTSYVETAPKPRTGVAYLTPPKSGSIGSDSVLVEWRYDFGKKAVVTSSYRVVLRVAVPVFDHPIKQIAFKGRFLLVAHGDASVQSAVGGGGMNNDGLGKILRIDPRRQANGAAYGVPKENPFIGKGMFVPELKRTLRFPAAVYAAGFRNPHTVCVARDGTVFSTDAGRDNAEEVNIVRPGGVYGWPEREGTFVHLKKPDSGTGEGYELLPDNDARNGYTYPAAQVGHIARRGAIFQSQAIAGGCPVENGSPLSGTFWFTNFPSNGQMFYSWVGALKRAVTKGPPSKLRPAMIYSASVVYERPGKPPLPVDNFMGVVRADGQPRAGRVDVRIGRGPNGEMLVSSKTTGTIYLVTNSVPKKNM